MTLPRSRYCVPFLQPCTEIGLFLTATSGSPELVIFSRTCNCLAFSATVEPRRPESQRTVYGSTHQEPNLSGLALGFCHLVLSTRRALAIVMVCFLQKSRSSTASFSSSALGKARPRRHCCASTFIFPRVLTDLRIMLCKDSPVSTVIHTTSN